MSNFNKVITNIPVPLTETEVSNLSQTLSGIVQGGGGGGGKTYNGDGVYVTVNNDVNPGIISLTQTSLDKLNRPIPSAVADLTDADEYATKSFVAGTYQTIAGMNDYQTKDDMSAYLTKASASENLAPISVTADVEVLKANSGDFTQYYKKTETSSKEQLSTEFAKYQLSGNYVNQSDYDIEDAAIWQKLQTLDGTKQDNLDFDLDEHGNISAINDIPLAGQGGKTYSAGAGIAIVDDYISISADYIQAITSVSGKQNKLAFGYDNSGCIVTINNSAIAGEGGGGGVVYNGADGVYVNGSNIGLSAGYKTQVEAVSSKLDSVTTAATLSGDGTTNSPLGIDTTASMNLTNASAKSAVYASQYWDSINEDYASLTDDFADLFDRMSIAEEKFSEYYKKTETSSKSELSAALTGKQDKLTFAGESNTITSINNSAIGGGTSFTGVTTAGSISGDGLTNPLGLVTSAENALTSIANKVDKPIGTGLADDFLIYQTTGTISGWESIDNWWQTKSSEVVEYEYIPSTILPQQGLSSNWNESRAELSFGISADYVNAITSVSGKVDKPNTATTPELNNNYLIYSTLTGTGTTTGWMPLSANYYSKTEADGRYAKASAALTSVSANAPLSGNGTTVNPLGFDLTDAYTIDGTNGITAIPNSTTNKVVVQMTNDVWADTQVVHSSISAWNEVSGLSAKSTVSANTATNVISVSANSTATTANLSATTYYTNTADSNLVAQRLFVVHNDNDLIAHVQGGCCQGQGSLFFVMSGFNS